MDFIGICFNWARKENVLKSLKNQPPTHILYRCFEFEDIKNLQGGINLLYFKPTVVVIRWSILSACNEISIPPVQLNQIKVHLSTSLVVRKRFCVKEKSK